MSVDAKLLAIYRKLEKRIAEVAKQQGPRGPKGRKGQPGPQGPQGPAGDTGKTGPAGPRGLSGSEGPKGADGIDGTHGADGKDGVGISDAHIDFDGHLVLSMTDGTVIDAGMVTVTDEGVINYIAGGGIPDKYKSDLQDAIDHISDTNNPHNVTHQQLPDTGLDNSHPMSAITGLLADQQRQDDYAFRNTKVFFQSTQPDDNESSAGDMWWQST